MIIHGTITCQRIQTILALCDRACLFLQSIYLQSIYLRCYEIRYFLVSAFFLTVDRRGPFRVREFVCVRWPRTGSPLR